MNTVFGIKQTMTQAWQNDGRRVPVTMVRVNPLTITHIKSQEKDGYSAFQLGFGTRSIKNIKKPQKVSLRGAIKEQKAPRFLRETRISGEQITELKAGDVVKASDVLNAGDIVKVSGISKGKGWAGVVKRWGFSGGPKTHGQSDRHRAPGSIGQGTTPGRVYKGKKMAGRMGATQKTVRNLTVLNVTEDGTVLISGLIPGVRGGVVRIEKLGHTDKLPGIMSLETKEEQTEQEEK